MTRLRILIAGIVCAGLGPISHAADSAVELSRLLPGDTNTVSVVRVARILESERAKAEDWAETANEKFLTGASRIPPWVSTLVIGALVRPELHEQVWSTGLLELPPVVTMERIARREESRVEKLAGLRSVRAQRNAFLIEIKPRTLGVRTPAIRQEAARWARFAADGKTGTISEYLQSAIKHSADIIHAVDLTDTSDVRGVQRYLEDHELVPQDVVARVDLPRLLSSLRGVSFFVTIEKSTSAKVVLNFGEDATNSAKDVASIFRHVMDDMQMSLDEFDSAKVTTQSRSVTLSMELSDESLRRVLSLITATAPPHGADDESLPSEPTLPHESVTRVENELAASQRYYRSVTQVIDDIDRVNTAGKSSRSATWLDNFSRRLDHLPTAGVERELLGFGRRVSERIRALAASLRGQGVQVNSEQQTLVYDVDYKPGWAAASYWGVVGYGEPSYKVSSNLQEVRERQAAAVTKGSQQRISIWNLITSDRAGIEKRMRDQHGDDFFKTRR
ncbi:MAG: hypothetical protein ACI8P0_003721 [Planctomycetaceae bacterium]|jgi:hypothetical protein